ncbi:transmembrane protein 205-like isoform X1 [Argonauta hians]
MVPVTQLKVLGVTGLGAGIVWKIFSSWHGPNAEPVLNALHLGSFAINFGAQQWVSFIAGPVMIMVLPRHKFGEVQSKLFPCYFALETITSTITLVTYILKHPAISWENNNKLQVALLSSNIVFSILNFLVFGPKSTEAMFRRHAVEQKAGVGHEVGFVVDRTELMKNPLYAAINKAFSRLHMASTFSNFMVMMGNYSHLFSIAFNGI